MKHITSIIIVFIFILAAVFIPGYTETTADAAAGLKGYGAYGIDIIINGGDTFVSRLIGDDRKHGYTYYITGSLDLK